MSARAPAYPPVAETTESELVRALLPDDAPPYLVDVGAHDGVSMSTSLPLVASGWAAVLVEPHPEVFERLLYVHGANPAAYCVRGACSNEAGTFPLHLGAGDNTMLSSLLSHDADALPGPTQAGTSVEVTVYLLRDLLAARQWPADYSLLLVDTEGLDGEVLEGAGLDTHRARIIVTEEYPTDPARLRRKHELLWSHGYVLFGQVGPNTVWIEESWWPDALRRYWATEPILTRCGPHRP